MRDIPDYRLDPPAPKKWLTCPVCGYEQPSLFYYNDETSEQVGCDNCIFTRYVEDLIDE